MVCCPNYFKYGLENGGLPIQLHLNGWYMVTEIGVRNFTDSYRYNLLEKLQKPLILALKIIHLIGSSTRRIKLCSLSFFKSEGVSIVDHLTASKQFEMFERNEQK